MSDATMAELRQRAGVIKSILDQHGKDKPSIQGEVHHALRVIAADDKLCSHFAIELYRLLDFILHE